MYKSTIVDLYIKLPSAILYNMSAVDDLLIILSSYHNGYHLMRRRLAGDTRPVFSRRGGKEIKENTFRITLSRLKKHGLVENTGRGIWSITEKGKRYLISRRSQNRETLAHGEYKTAAAKRKKKNLIVAFDIPESYRRKRDWLRFELVALGFVPLQKSVWFGPAPLPREFISNLNDLNLLRCMKFFRATKEEVI